MAIRYHLKAMLADKDMTQKELAEVTKIRAPTISAICVGSVKQLPIGVLDKICTVLDCQPGDLLEYVPTEDTAGAGAVDVAPMGPRTFFTDEYLSGPHSPQSNPNRGQERCRGSVPVRCEPLLHHH